ncbi:MAG: hypothetical protein UZ21_OP11001000413 [Microgenomates bacterium OLB22]|nr:MAG: hypothetical protein UZ21_OP11001000413 [Microgenomates bacterium OLB22]
MNTSLIKDKRQLAYLGLMVLFVVVTLLFALRDRITFFNRASTPQQCVPSSVSCRLDVGSPISGPYRLKLIDDSGKELKKSEVLDTATLQDVLTYSFDASKVCRDGANSVNCDNIAGFKCIAEYTDPQLAQCNATTSLRNECTQEVTPTVPEQCSCSESGLDCDGGIKEESYKKGDEVGPGLIELNPRFSGPACFECKQLVVRDSKGITETFDCSGYPKDASGLLLPTPTVIRLRQAQGSACMTYTLELEGVTGKTPTTSSYGACGECKQQVCCPACQKPTTLPDPNDPSKLSCSSNQCKFSFVSFPNQCPRPGDTQRYEVAISAPGTYCIDGDQYGQSSAPDDQCRTVTATELSQAGGKILWQPSIPYPNAGVYDVKLRCDIDRLDDHIVPIKTPEYCVQRFSVSCNDRGGPPGDGGPGEPTETPIPTATPVPPTKTPTPTKAIITPTGICTLDGSLLNVRMSCPTCK